MGEDWDVEALAPAKLNLALAVVGKRADGFHDLHTVFQAVDLEDRLRFRRRESGIHLSVNAYEPIAEGPENLVARAALILSERRGIRHGVEIQLEKRIPAGVGLGGGSSDAAATLLALERLWGLDPDPEERRRLALLLGSDVPFFLEGGTALGEGRGEILTPLSPPPRFGWLLLVPTFRVSTGDAFRMWESSTNSVKRVNMLVAAMKNGELSKFIENLVNDLQAGVVRIQPRLARSERELRSLGATAVGLTGSGSGLFALFMSEGAVADLLEAWFSPPGADGFRRSSRISDGGVVPLRPIAFGARVIS